MSETKKKWKTKVTVLSIEVDFEGRRKKDQQPFTCYAITALDEAGQPIGERLRTFEGQIKLHELIEVNAELREDDRHGKTITLTPLDSKPKTLAESVDELRLIVNRLEQRVSELESHNPGSQSLATAPGQGGPTF